MIIAGVDEVGRGALAGPVFAAVVVFKHHVTITQDSKKLSQEKRISIYNKLIENCYFAVGTATVEEIDQVNILNATLLAMKRAIQNLQVKPDIILIDGKDQIQNTQYKTEAIIKGDEKIMQIAAASVIAKVQRDRFMIALDKDFPLYFWSKNKGYGTKTHFSAILQHGITRHHRKTFAPCLKLLNIKDKEQFFYD